MNFDITIIGGSFAGMSAALSLALVSPDIKIAIIEKQDIKNNDRKPDGRGYAISNKSLALFREIAIFDEATKDSGVIKDIKITDGKFPLIVDFLSQEVGEKNFGALIESYVIHNALRNKVLQTKNISLFCPNVYGDIRFLEDEVEVDVEGDVGTTLELSVQGREKFCLKSKLLLACDGRFSMLRDKFQIATNTKNYNQIAIVFNIKHQKPHRNIAWEKFLPGGPIAILPLQNQHNSSIVWIAPKQEAEAILSLDKENFTHQLNKKIVESCGEIEVVSEKFSYPLIMVEAKKLYHEKMLLVGDASCGVHPIAGQGLNLGLQSVKILQELVREYFLSGLEINSLTLLEKYNKQAKFEAKKMVVATDVLNSIFKSNSMTLGIARDLGLSMVDKISYLKKFFIRNAGG
jgi:2-octaprenyl-6-methoxyphenol hydroxylase